MKGVILDIDGTLVDSNDHHAHAWVEALAEHGHDVPYDRVRRLIGMGGDKLLPEVTGLNSEEEPGKTISQRRGEIFKAKYLPHLKPTNGAADLIDHLKRSGYTLIVASSAKQEELTQMLELVNGSDLQTVSFDDIEKSKPDPDAISVALEKSGLKPEDAVMLGDTPYDIQAAEKVGVKSIALRSGGWQDADLPGAAAVYADPADLLAHFDESPLVS